MNQNLSTHVILRLYKKVLEAYEKDPQFHHRLLGTKLKQILMPKKKSYQIK